MANTLTPAQIHSISWVSNAAFDLKETSFQALQETTTNIVTTTLSNSTVQSLIGNWTIVWGPVVYSNNPDAATVVADNTMLLVYNSDVNAFVVGIAGTNAVSTFGWMQEDFNVSSLVTWPSIIGTQPNPWWKGNACISAGTNTGLQILLAMQGSELTASPPVPATMLQALNDFVKANNITGAQVAVTGHSLGGALSPTMAVFMHDTLSTWNTNGGIAAANISAWPTAGPTPGNALFANHITNSLGSNYNSYFNSIDVVPQAWQATTLETIPEIYNPSLPYPESAAPYSTFVGTLVSAVFLKTINSADFLPIDYQQATPWNSMTGAFDTTTDSNAQTEASLVFDYEPSGLTQYGPYFSYFFRFISQAAYQHTTAYNDLLGISAFAAEYSSIKNGIVGSTVEERLATAVRAAVSNCLGMPDLNPIIAAKMATPAPSLS